MVRCVEPVSAFSLACHGGWEFARAIKNLPARIGFAAEARRKLRMAAGRTPRVNYGSTGPAFEGRLPIGGQIKLLHLRREFPECAEANLIYLVSSALPEDAEAVVKRGKALGMKLVWNQNGVAYPGCYGASYPWFNRRMAKLRAHADYIVNQSRFSEESAERYLGPAHAPSEICFNPVDTSEFAPSAERKIPRDGARILAAGTSHALYRTKSAVDVTRELLRRGRDVELVLAGEFRWRGASAQVAAEIKDLGGRVVIVPPFSQAGAVALYQEADVLLHTKYNDPCPTVPIEAMACGLPVVGTASGGMPELVDAQSGVLVPIRQGWDQDLPADPGLLADAVETVLAHRENFAKAARQRALDHFDVEQWMERHRKIFATLV